MEKIGLAMVGALAVAAFVVIIAPLAALFGAISGWLVGLFFDETIASTLHVAGFDGLASTPLWKIGATLGFVGGFFRASQTNNNN